MTRKTINIILSVMVISVLVLCFRTPSSETPRSETLRIYSSQVQDSFDIQLREHINDNGLPISSIYVLDSEIDNRVDRLHDSLVKYYDTSFNFQIIGIGQTHFSKALRKRDFVPPSDGSFLSKEAVYSGNADKFYNFILEDIIPKYDISTHHRILIGHSFGGLFGVYVSTLENSPFYQIHALSPSLWINYSDAKSNYVQDTAIHISTNLNIHFGGLEQLNKVAFAVEEFENVMRAEDKKILKIHKVEWATHMSILEEMFKPEFIF